MLLLWEMLTTIIMKHKFTALKVLNITTGFLHTEVGEIYEFFNEVIESGIMTHNLPNAAKAIRPILESQLDPTFFEYVYRPLAKYWPDVEIEITEQNKVDFWNNFNSLPNPLAKFTGGGE